MNFSDLLNSFNFLLDRLNDPETTPQERLRLQTELSNLKQTMVNTGVFTFDGIESKFKIW